jgi:hypothetical protein
MKMMRRVTEEEKMEREEWKEKKRGNLGSKRDREEELRAFMLTAGFVTCLADPPLSTISGWILLSADATLQRRTETAIPGLWSPGEIDVHSCRSEEDGENPANSKVGSGGVGLG